MTTWVPVGYMCLYVIARKYNDTGVTDSISYYYAYLAVQDPSFVFSPVQTGLPRELAKLLTRTTQPGLVSPGGGDQAQRYRPASLSSESGESLRHVGCYSVKCVLGSRA